MTAVYELDGVTRAYRSGERRVEALAGVDLAVRAGEHVAVVGPSGSGKTTLLQLLGALDRPSAGALRFEGRDLSGLGEGELTAVRLRGVGFVFQQFNLVPTLSARGNVEAALAPLRLGRAERRRRALERLEEVGLGGREGHLPGQLSGGEQQRVAIARALAKDPRVILADEPTGQLDAAASDAVAALLGSLAGEGGRTVVVVTHDLDVASRAPRIVRLADGRVAEDGASDRVSGLKAIELPVGDVGEAVAWYGQALGLAFDADGTAALGRAARLALVRGTGGGARIVLEVADLAGATERLRAAGVQSAPYGAGVALRDPWGNPLTLAARGG